MAGVGTPELAAAVSNAGGLGSLDAGYRSPQAFKELIETSRTLTSKPLMANFFVPQKVAVDEHKVDKMKGVLRQCLVEMGEDPSALDSVQVRVPKEKFEALIDVGVSQGIDIMSFTFGIPPADTLSRLQRAGVRVFGTATTVKEAIAVERAGCDGVVVQGSDAGSHRAFFLPCNVWPPLVGTFSLLSAVSARVRVPVVAAGGIMNGQGVAAALALGAAGVQMGTAFIPCPESAADTLWKQTVLNNPEYNSTVTNGFSGRYGRGVCNRYTELIAKMDVDIPDWMIQLQLYSVLKQIAKRKNNAAFQQLWCGQGSTLSRVMPAGELVRTLVQEYSQTVERLPSQL
eukprot:GILK01012867.1.p1 GENE.GILK01012867.1~~GILK01012867.1.p1  ORF type:complete len:343 (+),score=48.00 GILK01012867.1:272-1300(+)